MTAASSSVNAGSGDRAPAGASAPRTPHIAGLGVCVPERVMANAEFAQFIDTSDEWIRTRTGIRERRIAGAGVTTSDLAAAAARSALADAGVAASDVGLVIVATFSPDCPYPATACAVQRKIGATNAAAFDLSAMCSGFVYALSVASQFIRTGAADNVLVIGAEKLSSVLDYTDRTTCILFGDAAGAALVSSRGQGREVLGTWMGSDGEGFELLWQPAGGASKPATAQTVADREHFLRMKGREVFRIAVKKFQEGIRRAAELAGWELTDIDMIVPHQVNTRIIEAVVERLGISGERFAQNLERYGNTSAASIPLALYESVAAGRLKAGDRVVLAAVGGGMTWGSAALRW
jgi:3-oxoacyl-[acyl-carrier-protein] synthase-3